MSTREERERIERIIEERELVPPLAEQLAIKAEAIALARESLGLEGAERYRSLAAEKEFLRLSMRASEGEDVSWPGDLSWRAAAAPAAGMTVSIGSGPTSTPGTADVNVISGGFAPFSQPTLTESAREGKFVEEFRAGSLRRTIRERGDRVPLRLSHGAHPYIGRQPIGKITQLEERRSGGHFAAHPDPFPTGRRPRAADGSGRARVHVLRFRTCAARRDVDEGPRRHAALHADRRRPVRDHAHGHACLSRGVTRVSWRCACASCAATAEPPAREHTARMAQLREQRRAIEKTRAQRRHRYLYLMEEGIR